MATKAEKILALSSGFLQTAEALQLGHLLGSGAVRLEIPPERCRRPQPRIVGDMHSLTAFLHQCWPPASGSREQHKGIGTIILSHIASDLIATQESLTGFERPRTPIE